MNQINKHFEIKLTNNFSSNPKSTKSNFDSLKKSTIYQQHSSSSFYNKELIKNKTEKLFLIQKSLTLELQYVRQKTKFMSTLSSQRKFFLINNIMVNIEVFYGEDENQKIIMVN